jgi:outer membrane protein assembly factor BamB
VRESRGGELSLTAKIQTYIGEKMKSSIRITATIVTAILVSLMASSLVTVCRSVTDNFNPDSGKTTLYAPYMSASNSAQAVAAAKYPNPLDEKYAWIDYLCNGPERQSFNPGPAPDRPEILWKTTDIPAIGSAMSGNVAYGGNLYLVSTGPPYVPGGPPFFIPTATTYINKLDPYTGTIKGQLSLGTQSVSSAFGAATIYKVDDHHLLVRIAGGFFGLFALGVTMINTDTMTRLWNDSTITPGAVYHPAIMDQKSIRLFGPQTVPGNGYNVPSECCWDMSSPEVDKGPGNRLLWTYTMDEPGNPQLCYGDGKVFMGSYSSQRIYCLNATTGVKIWETARFDAAGYAATYADDRVFVGCQSQHEICYNATTGKVIWDNDDGVANRAFNVWNVAYAYGRVYFHDLGALLTGGTKCYDARTGKKLWSAPTYQWIGYYQTVIGDGKIYGMQSDGSTTTGRPASPVRFSCWDAFTGQEIWGINLNVAWPIIAYGCLYLGTGSFMGGGTTYCLSTAKAPQDWSMWRGNVDHPGVTTSTGPSNLTQGPKWTFTAGAGIISSPVIAKGKLYINCNDRYTYCLDAYTGKLIWKFQTNEPRMTTFGSTPAVVDDKVIVGPDDSNLYCLNASTGAKLWQKNMGAYTSIEVSLGEWNGRSSPIIYKNMIYVGSAYDNYTYCIDLNGNQVWRYNTQGPIISSAAISNNTVFMLSWGPFSGFATDGYCFELNADTGTLVRNFTVHTQYTNPNPAAGMFGNLFSNNPSHTPVVVGNRIYMGIDTANLVCYDVNGTRIYPTLTGAESAQPHVLGENTVTSCLYLPDGDGLDLISQYTGSAVGNTGGTIITPAGPTMTAIRADNGSNIWSAWGGWAVWSSPCVAGIGNTKQIYCGSESYSMTVWNASTGKPISWYTTGGNIPGSPAIWDGKLYFGSADNKVYCFEDHPTHEMTVSMTLDKTEVNINKTESVTATVLLQSKNSLAPGLPNAPIIVTFTKPDGTMVNVTATTDNYGLATLTYTPNVNGTWKAIAWYVGKDFPTYSYGYAFSDQIPIKASYTASSPPPPPPPPPTTTTGIPIEDILAAVAIIVIVIIVAVGYMLMKRRKK